MSQDQPPDKESTPLNDVWAQLDAGVRARIVDLFAHLAMRHAAALHEKATKEGEGVSQRSEKQDRAGAY